MSEQTKAPENSNWNYLPDLPLQSPWIFRLQPDPRFTSIWLRINWFNFTAGLIAFLTLFLWIWVYLDLVTAKEF